MRSLAVLTVSVAALSLALSLGACAAGRSAGEGAQTVREGFGAAATAPLEDLNLRRTEIPMVLLEAQANPYDMRGLNRCPAIAAAVRRLDDALGPDLDEPPPPEGYALRSEQASDIAARATLGAIRDTATDILPMRNWVRRLSGAEQHSEAVRAAVRAGQQRRAFLKGMGMQRNCAPPAAPSWFSPPQR